MCTERPKYARHEPARFVSNIENMENCCPACRKHWDIRKVIGLIAKCGHDWVFRWKSLPKPCLFEVWLTFQVKKCARSLVMDSTSASLIPWRFLHTHGGGSFFAVVFLSIAVWTILSCFIFSKLVRCWCCCSSRADEITVYPLLDQWP